MTGERVESSHRRRVCDRRAVRVGDGDPMSLACRTHGHAGCVGAEQDDCEIVTLELVAEDERLLGLFTAAQILFNAPPSHESVPMMSEAGHAALVAHVRRIAVGLAEAATPRGADLWIATQ